MLKCWISVSIIYFVQRKLLSSNTWKWFKWLFLILQPIQTNNTKKNASKNPSPEKMHALCICMSLQFKQHYHFLSIYQHHNHFQHYYHWLFLICYTRRRRRNINKENNIIIINNIVIYSHHLLDVYKEMKKDLFFFSI